MLTCVNSLMFRILKNQRVKTIEIFPYVDF